MINMTSTEAKTHFGALLDMALQVLQNDLNAGIHQADQGLLVDSDTAFNGLI